MIYLISPMCADGLSCLEGFPDDRQYGVEPPLVQLSQILALDRKAQHSPLRYKDIPGTYKKWEGREELVENIWHSKMGRGGGRGVLDLNRKAQHSPLRYKNTPDTH